MTEDIEYQVRLTEDISFTMKQLKFLEEKYENDESIPTQTDLWSIIISSFKPAILLLLIFFVAAVLGFSYHVINQVRSNSGHAMNFDDYLRTFKNSPELRIVTGSVFLVWSCWALVSAWFEKRKRDAIRRKLFEIRSMQKYLGLLLQHSPVISYHNAHNNTDISTSATVHSGNGDR